jgi:hypothetical protein
MAMTLDQMARQYKDDFAKEVVLMYAQHLDISKKLPIETIGTTEVVDSRSDSAVTVGFRSRGEAFPAVQGGGYDEIADAVFPMGGTIDIDKMDMRNKKLSVDPLSKRTKEAVDGLSWTFRDAFINGDHGVNPKSFEGIKVRIATLGSEQTIFAKNSTTALDVAAELASTTPSNAVFQQFLDAIDNAKSALDGGTADLAVTSFDFIRAVKASLRRLNLYKDVSPLDPSLYGKEQQRTWADASTKPVWHYEEVPFYTMGREATQTNEIVGTTTVGGAACRPVYFLKTGRPYLYGIQQYAPEVDEPFKMPDGTTWRTVIDWPVGLHHIHKFGMSVLKGAKVA